MLHTNRTSEIRSQLSFSKALKRLSKCFQKARKQMCRRRVGESKLRLLSASSFLFFWTRCNHCWTTASSVPPYNNNYRSPASQRINSPPVLPRLLSQSETEEDPLAEQMAWHSFCLCSRCRSSPFVSSLASSDRTVKGRIFKNDGLRSNDLVSRRCWLAFKIKAESYLDWMKK